MWWRKVLTPEGTVSPIPSSGWLCPNRSEGSILDVAPPALLLLPPPLLLPDTLLLLLSPLVELSSNQVQRNFPWFLPSLARVQVTL